MTGYISHDFLNELHSLRIYPTVIEGKFLNGGVFFETDGQILKSLGSDLIVIEFEFDDAVIRPYEHSRQELASQFSDVVVDQVQVFDAIDLLDVVANRP